MFKLLVIKFGRVKSWALVLQLPCCSKVNCDFESSFLEFLKTYDNSIQKCFFFFKFPGSIQRTFFEGQSSLYSQLSQSKLCQSSTNRFFYVTTILYRVHCFHERVKYNPSSSSAQSRILFIPPQSMSYFHMTFLFILKCQVAPMKLIQE